MSVANIGAWLAIGTARLANAGIESARLDCLLLLEDALDCDRGWLLAHPEHELASDILDGLNKKIARRASHIPLAYIRGQSEFYGRTFLVNEHVLVPRPESETMIELLVRLPELQPQSGSQQVMIVDIGTGSGALAISAKLALPAASVLGTDIDSACLAVARDNAQGLGAVVEFLIADLLQPLGNDNPAMHGATARRIQADIILANLPYVPDGYAINQAAAHEPVLALFGGADGLALYRRLFVQLQQLERPCQHLLTEVMEFQHDDLAKVAVEAGYAEAGRQGLVQIFKFL